MLIKTKSLIHLTCIILVLMHVVQVFGVEFTSFDKYRWGGVEIIAYKNELNIAETLKSFPIVANETVSMLKLDEAYSWCDNLIVDKSLDSAECSIYKDDEEKKIYLILDFYTAEEPVVDPKKLSEVFLDSKLMKLKKRIEEAIAEKRSHKNDVNYKAKRSTKGLYVTMFNDNDLSKRVQKLTLTIPTYKSHLIKILKDSQDYEEREQAAFLLNWSGLTRRDLKAIIDKFPDDSFIVDYQLLDLFNAYAFLIDKKMSLILLNKLQQFLPWSQPIIREKSLIVIDKLLQQDPKLKAQLKKEAKEYILHAGKNSGLPKTRAAASSILSKL